MVEFKAISYEESRLEYFRKQRDSAERRMNYWCRPKQADRVGWMEASDRASEAGAQYNYYKDALEALENQPKWLSPTEGLPEPNTAVIVALDDGHVFQARYNYDGWDLWEGCNEAVMCWTPMPTPPKEVLQCLNEKQ